MQILKMIYCYYMKQAEVYFWSENVGLSEENRIVNSFQWLFLINPPSSEKMDWHLH